MSVPDFHNSFAAAIARFARIPDLRFTPIDAAALDYRRRHWPRVKDRHTFDWDAIAATDLRRKSHLFSIAMYSGSALFGCVLGRLVSAYGWIELDRVEGSRQRDPAVKGMVVPCMLTVVEDYARRHGFASMRITSPTDGAFDHYAAQPGYTHRRLNADYDLFEKQILATAPRRRRDFSGFMPSAAPPAPL